MTKAEKEHQEASDTQVAVAARSVHFYRISTTNIRRHDYPTSCVSILNSREWLQGDRELVVLHN